MNVYITVLEESSKFSYGNLHTSMRLDSVKVSYGLTNPLNVGRHLCIDTWKFLAATAISPSYNTNQQPLRINQWSTGVPCARVLPFLASTNHRVCNSILAVAFSTGKSERKILVQ